MTSADHKAAAELLVSLAESEAMFEAMGLGSGKSEPLATLASWHANEAERLALDAVDLVPAPHPEAEPYAHHFTATPGDDAINA